MQSTTRTVVTTQPTMDHLDENRNESAQCTQPGLPPGANMVGTHTLVTFLKMQPHSHLKCGSQDHSCRRGRPPQASSYSSLF